MTTVRPHSEKTPHLVVRTVPFAHRGTLLPFLDKGNPLFYERRSFGLVGQGIALEQHFTESSRFADASDWWTQVVANSEVFDSVDRPGTGLCSFGRFAFFSWSTRQSSIVVPRVIVGQDSQGSWLTTIDTPNESPQSFEIDNHQKIPVEWRESPHQGKSFEDATTEAIRLIRESSLEKVVLGRQVVADSDQVISVQALLAYLGETHPETYRFALEGLVGASPEMLSRVRGNEIVIDVLAGSAPRGGAVDSDKSQREMLLSQKKDLLEHELAVKSVVDAMREIPDIELNVGELSTLALRDLVHLSTSIRGMSSTPLKGLELLEKLHPTASVAGTPREVALRVISELEGADRGFFAGPVGWLDAKGNQEFVLALRSAELSPDRKRITAFAGAGIVEDSVPHKELEETALKFKTIQDYFL